MNASIPSPPGTDGRAARAQRWRFADCVLDARTLELRLRGELVKLEPKPLDLLMFLLRHPGEVVTKDELQEAVWPGRMLSESVLTKAVAKLRQGLGDEDQTIVKTVHGFGYRLIAPVTLEASAASSLDLIGLKAGDTPPLRPLWRLREPLGAGTHGEVWRIEHEKTGESRVLKFARDAAGLGALKREITLFRLLQATYGPRVDFLRLLDWNLEELPYFLEAEHVAGGSLLQWTERLGGFAALPRELRLELIAQLADTLAAAHAAGVLHKDLKPANVLMGGSMEAPQPKLGDFGSGGVDAARLAQLEITRLGFTHTAIATGGSEGGTSLYLAPELLAGQQPTVQSDIYALGVIAYQLLVGDWRRPLAPGWEQTLDDELLREDIAAAAAGDPQQRLGDAAELGRRLRRLEERRAERNREQQALAEAARLRAELEHAQHRRRLQRVALALLALGLGFSSWGFWSARTEARRAEAAAAEARAAVSFLADDVLAAIDPFGGGRPKLSIHNLLDEAAPRLAERLADYPAMRAEMGLAMGRAYEGLGDWDVAAQRLRIALAEAENAQGADAVLTLRIVEQLAATTLLQSRYEESEQLYRRVHERRRAQLGERHADTLAARDGLALVEYERGHFAGAAALQEALVKDYRGIDEAGLASAQWGLADCYLELNRFTDAERLLHEAIATNTRLQGAQHPHTLWQRTSLGDALMVQGRYDEAQAVFEQSYEGLSKVVGERHPYTLTALHYRGQVQLERGNAAAALPLLQGVHEARVQTHGEDHVWTRYSTNRVGAALTRLGRASEALPMLERAHRQAQQHQGADHPFVLLIQGTLADALIAVGRYDAAEQQLLDALRLGTASLPADNTRLAYLHRSLGELRSHQGRKEDARREFTAAQQVLDTALGTAHPESRRNREEMARL